MIGTRARTAAVLAAVLAAAAGTVLGVGATGSANAAGPANVLVAGTPCTVTARACVDLATDRSWLLTDGAVVRGPVPIRHGDAAKPTPHGTFRVEWKAIRWTSREYLVQMPWSVFFAPGGVAFHQGGFDTPSAGCVKLGDLDAQAWFDHLQVGDEVQVR